MPQTNQFARFYVGLLQKNSRQAKDEYNRHQSDSSNRLA